MDSNHRYAALRPPVLLVVDAFGHSGLMRLEAGIQAKGSPEGIKGSFTETAMMNLHYAMPLWALLSAGFVGLESASYP